MHRHSFNLFFSFVESRPAADIIFFYDPIHEFYVRSIFAFVLIDTHVHFLHHLSLQRFDRPLRNMDKKNVYSSIPSNRDWLLIQLLFRNSHRFLLGSFSRRLCLAIQRVLNVHRSEHSFQLNSHPVHP